MPTDGSNNWTALESLYYNIGGLRTRITGEQNLQAIAASKAFEVFRAEPGMTDAEIYTDETLDDIPFQSVYTFDFQKDTRCVYGKNGQTGIFRMKSSNGNCLRFHFDGENEVHVRTCNDYRLFFFALWMAFNLIGCRRQSLSIHSSCIAFQGKGILFLGESGTGKSTQSRLWRQVFPETELINDDGPFLAPVGDEYRIFGSPWSGKTPCYRNVSYPVKAIVRVVQAPENSIHPLSVLEKIKALLPSFPPALSRDKALQESVLSIVSRIVKDIPIYCLECRPDEEAVRVTYQALYEKPC